MPDALTVAQLSALPGVRTATGVAGDAGASGDAGVAGDAGDAGDIRNAGGVLPVAPELAGVLPWSGLRRGSTLAIHGSTSLLLALLAEATSAGSWAAVVGVPDLGVVAASELGVRVDRLALVPCPGGEFASVVAALLDGMDLVAVGSSTGQPDRQLRRLSSRARHRRAVLLSLGRWPGSDVELHYTLGRWSGPGCGAGYLRARDAVVHASGRGSAARPVSTEIRLPGVGGGVSSPGVPEPDFGVVWEAG